MKSDSIVIIPTYNEKENIENIIRAVFGLEKYFHILIIEDNSPDGTADIVRRMQQEFPDRLFMVERKGKLGLGTAYIAGFKWAIEHQYDYIFEMDADFSHAPADLPRLYDKCATEGYDVAIGSRYVSGVNVVNWPMGRVLMSYFASKYVRIITGLPIHVKAGKLYLDDVAVLDVPGVEDQPVYAGIRPEGFIPDSVGPMICNLSGVDVMGRDVSLVTTHPASLNPVVRSIVDADAAKNATGLTVSYSLKPHKVFLFNKETEARVYFEVK